MTLSTHIHINTSLDAEALFDLQLRAILTAGDVLDRYEGAQIRRSEPGKPFWEGGSYLSHDYGIATVIGQGLPALTSLDWQENQEPYTYLGVYGKEDYSWYEDEDEIAEAKAQRAEDEASFPEAVYRLNYDTAYGYTGPNGIGCSELHARAIAFIHENLPEGSTFHWHNEFTGEWFEGLNGMDGFLNNGDDAMNWFQNIAVPAIVQDIINNKENI